MGFVKLRPGDSRDILATKYEINVKDVFHLKNLYKLIHEWLEDEGFVAINDKSDKIETYYLEKTLPSGEKEHRIWWRSFRVPEGNNYYRYYLKIDWQTLSVKKIEIMHQGKKFKTNKGEVTLWIEAWLQLDYQDKWQNHPILKIFDNWFRTRFYLENIKSYKKDLYDVAFRLNQTIKQYLELKAPMDWGKPFHPPRGV